VTKIDIAGESFTVAVEGRSGAPAIILSHALGADLTMWDRQAPILAERFQVIRYNSRGHSGSPPAKGPLTIGDLGQDALAILDALGVAHAHWMGLSMGGAVGLWLLEHARERFDRAVLANTAAHFGSTSAWNERIETVRAKGVGAVAPSQIERWFTKAFREAHPEVVARILSILQSCPAEGYAACAAAIRDMDMREDMTTVRIPALVIVGSCDLSAPPPFGEEIARSIEGARLITLEAAHLSNIEAAEAFNRAALEFLTEA